MTVVLDASVLVAALVDSGPVGTWAEGIIGSDVLVAPELLLIETLHVIRRLERGGAISRLEATTAQRDALQIDAEVFPFIPFAERVWELRHNLTIYDASYVAVAEAFDASLATLDKKLAANTDARCRYLTP